VLELTVAAQFIEGGLLLGMDLENLVEPCQLERHKQIWMDAAKLEFPLGGIDPSLQAYQLTQHGRGTVLDVTEVEQDLFPGAVFDKRVKLVADFLNLILGHDLGVGEAHHEHTINVLNAEASARTLRHGKNSCSGVTERSVGSPTGPFHQRIGQIIDDNPNDITPSAFFHHIDVAFCIGLLARTVGARNFRPAGIGDRMRVGA
jgi:hypothetical protein